MSNGRRGFLLATVAVGTAVSIGLTLRASGAIGAKEVKELGEKVEKEEHRLFGQGGFDKTVGEVAAIEKEVGLYELAAFTPR